MGKRGGARGRQEVAPRKNLLASVFTMHVERKQEKKKKNHDDLEVFVSPEASFRNNISLYDKPAGGVGEQGAGRAQICKCVIFFSCIFFFFSFSTILVSFAQVQMG